MEPEIRSVRQAKAVPQDAEALRAARERGAAMSKLLMAFISTGLVFMVFPGTLLGVWNLLQISGREYAVAISPVWIQAHAHKQVFGWVGPSKHDEEAYLC